VETLRFKKIRELSHFVLVALATSWPVQADTFFTDFEILARVGSERFLWKDYSYLGNVIAKESGTRTSTNISANNFFRSSSGLIYGVELDSTDGHGDYYGDAWTGVVVAPAQIATTAASTHSGYTHSDIHGGYRFKTGPFSFNVLAGVVHDE